MTNLINTNREFCYRITHVDNLDHILKYGLCSKNHPDANPGFVSIGNNAIISTRDHTRVRAGQGSSRLGEYVPFYFTPRSIMLYNIVTGYWHPEVPRRKPEEIIIMRCLIHDLAELEYIFTDGQANAAFSRHFDDLQYLGQIDWDCIQKGDFSKSGDDVDRPRRYQAEFMVKDHIPQNYIESLFVVNTETKEKVDKVLQKHGINDLPVQINRNYYF